MITINPIEIDKVIFTAVQVELPNTNVYMISNDIGYIIGSTINIDFDFIKESHETVAASVSMVNSIDDLLLQPLRTVTSFSTEFYHWEKGMIARQALLLIA